MDSKSKRYILDIINDGFTEEIDFRKKYTSNNINNLLDKYLQEISSYIKDYMIDDYYPEDYYDEISFQDLNIRRKIEFILNLEGLEEKIIFTKSLDFQNISTYYNYVIIIRGFNSKFISLNGINEFRYAELYNN